MRISSIVLPLSVLFLLAASPLNERVSVQQQLFVLKTLKPDLEVVGLIVSGQAEDRANLDRAVRRAAAGAGVRLVVSEAANIADVGPRFRQLVREHRVGAIWVVSADPVMNDRTVRSFLIEQSARAGLILLAPDRSWVRDGATLALEPAAGGASVILNERLASTLAIQVPESLRSQVQMIAAIR
jgi:ABC-type uncharacterized transport system substrate-binding protein